VALQTVSGSAIRCIEGLKFSGTGYNFRGRKLSVDAEAEAKVQACTSS
jgi:hypothetical protein